MCRRDIDDQSRSAEASSRSITADNNGGSREPPLVFHKDCKNCKT